MVDLCVLRGAPPHVVWLRLGNCGTSVVREVLARNDTRIQQLGETNVRVALSLFRFSAVDVS